MKTLVISLSFLLAASGVSGQISFPSGLEFPAIHRAPFELPAGSQQHPAVAFDGTNYLVVWVDSRGDKDAIMGARISQSGEVLDPVGFVISDPVTDALVTEPDIAWNGESFLVVWEYSFFTMVGRRVSLDGELVDPTVRTFFTGGFVTPAVASNGDSFLVLNAGDVPRAGLMDRHGGFQSLDAAPLENLNGRTASVASDGSDYVISASGRSSSEIFTIAISSDGTTSLQEIVAASSDGSPFTNIEWTGSSYLITWNESFRIDPYRSRESTFGQYVGRMGQRQGDPFLLWEAPARAYLYDVCATGQEAVIVWNVFNTDQTDPRLMVASVRGQATSVPFPLVTESLNSSDVALSCAGRVPLLFWSGDETSTSRELYFRPLNASPQETISVTQSVPRQTHATTLTTSRASLLFWQEETGRSSQIRVGRVGPNGSITRGSDRAVAPSTVSQRYPRGATDGTSVLVVWTEEEPRFSRRLFGTRLSLRGERLDSEPFLISEAVAGEGSVANPENPPAIIWNGEYYLVAWGDSEKRIRMSRITRDGIVLDPGGVLVLESGRGADQSVPSMAVTDGGMTLLTWQDGMKPFVCPVLCGPPPPWARVAGALIAPSGNLASSAEIEISGERIAFEPAVAWNGHHFLVIWKGEGIEGIRLTPEGQSVSGTGAEFLILAEHKQSADALALIADGDRFIAAWSETNRGLWDTLIKGRILASVIERDGAVRGPSQVSPGAGNDRRPDILRTSAGGILFYYDRNVPESPYLEVRRIFGTGTTGFPVRRRPAR